MAASDFRLLVLHDTSNNSWTLGARVNDVELTNILERVEIDARKGQRPRVLVTVALESGFLATVLQEAAISGDTPVPS